LTLALPQPDDQESRINSEKGAIMSDLQTIEQIKSEFPLEWVLIGEPQTDEGMRLQGGRVLFHSLNRDDVYRKVVELRLPHFAVRYLGTMPENTALVL
jgi:hypothetical protein